MRKPLLAQHFILFCLLTLSFQSFSQFGDRQVIHEDVPDPSDLNFIEASDFDGDGVNELVYVSSTEQRYLIFKEVNGEYIEYNTGISTDYTNPQVADMNNDGQSDFVLLQGGNIYIARNQGGLSFSSPFIVTSFNYSFSDITLIDYDSNQFVDVLAVNEDGLYFLENTNNFQIHTPQNLISEVTEIPLFLDINDDGKYDVIDINSSKVYTNVDGVFSLTQKMESLGKQRLGDIDEDGDLDLVSNYTFFGDFYYFENLGNGTFHEEKKLLFSQINGDDVLALKYIYDDKFTDVDGDGDLDLLICGYNDADGSRYEYGIGWVENIDSYKEIQYHNIHRFTSGKFSDLDGDGDFDIVMTAVNNYRNENKDKVWIENINLSKNEYKSIIIDEESFQLENIPDFIHVPKSDGLGYNYFLSSEYHLLGLKQNTNGEYRIEVFQTDHEENIIDWTGYSSLLTYKDFNEDGVNEITYLHQGSYVGFFENREINRLSSYQFGREINSFVIKSHLLLRHNISQEQTSFSLSNFDDDNNLELLISSKSTDEFRAEYFPLGFTQIFDVQDELEELAFYEEKFYDVGDINGNNKPDLLSEDQYFEFTPPDLINPVPGVEGGLFIDFDGDNDSDIVVVADTYYDYNSHFDSSFWYERQDDGSISEKKPLNLPVAAKKFFFSDINLDGLSDFLYISPEGGSFWSKNSGSGNFSEPIQFSNLSPNIIKAADIDEDGDDDVVIAGDSYMYWFENKTIEPSTPALSINLTNEEAFQNDVVEIPVKLGSYSDLKSLSFSLEWDASVASFEEVSQFWVNNVSSGNFNIEKVSEGKLGFNWSNSEGIDIDEGTILFVINIKLTGNDNQSTSIQLSDDPIERSARNGFDQIIELESESSSIIIKENLPPTDISISSTEVNENQPPETLVGKLSTQDENHEQGFTYELVSGEGDEDNNAFQIKDDELQTARTFDYEDKNSFTVRIMTSDPGRKSYQKSLGISITNTNDVPTNISLSSLEVDENQDVGLAVGSFTTSDQDEGDEHSYQFVSGDGDDDNEAFTIEGDKLLTAEIFDFEEKSIYIIRVEATDSQGAKYVKSFEISIINLPENEPPTDITLSNADVEENQPIGTIVGKLFTKDNNDSEGFTYEFVSGEGDEDNVSFSINKNELLTSVVFDFEEFNSYSIRLKTTDSEGASFQKAFEIRITDVEENTNAAPTNITLSNLSVNENEDAGTVVGTLASTDEDEEDEHTYKLVGGEGSDGNDFFAIKDDQLLTLERFDFESQSTYNVRIQTDDGNGGKFSKSFTISINDVEEITNLPPTDIALSNQLINENEPGGTLVGTLSTIDPDEEDEHTYTLVDGEGAGGNDFFTIKDNRLLSLISLDYEELTSTSIRVEVSDGNGGVYQESFTITIEDVDDDPNAAPTDLTLSNNTIDENEPVGTVIGTFSATDPDGDDLFYSLVEGNGGADNASFFINDNQLKASESFDYELKSRYNIRVQADDGQGGTISRQFQIDVNDLDDTPNNFPTAINISNQSIAENLEIGTVIGEFSTEDEDQDDNHTYQLVDGENANEFFSISGNQLLTGIIHDYEDQETFIIRVQTDDGNGGTYTQSFIINVTDEPENTAPTAINLSFTSVEENKPAGTLVGELSAEDDGSTFTFELVSGAGDDDNGLFTISGSTLLTDATFDYETKSNYTVRIRVSDSEGESIEETFTISITDINDNNSPVLSNFVTDQTFAVEETFSFAIPANTFTDQDEGDELTYSVTLGNGDPLPTWLSFDPESMTFSGTPIENGNFSIRITATDKGGATASDEFNLTIEGVTAIGEELSKHYNIYPNPSQTYLIIEKKDVAAQIQYCRIIDNAGKIIKEWQVNSVADLEIDLNDLKPGSYHLELVSEEETVRTQVLKH